MQHDVLKEWMDISIAIEEIAEFVESKSFSDYCEDKLLQAGLERKLEVIGEALHRIENIDKPRLEEVLPEYRKIIGLRNVIAHGYDVIDREIIWDLVINKIPDLRITVSKMLDQQ